MTTDVEGRTSEADRPLLLRFGFWVGILLLALILAGLIVLLWLAVLDRERDEEVLTVLLASALLLMVATFAVVAMAYKRAGLADTKQALALPEGSVRALIAFVLLLIFAMMAIFLFERIDSTSDDIEGITPEQFEELDLTTLASAEPRRDDAGNIVEYRIRLQQEPNLAQEDLAKQLTTALITLVTALAAFYFGARTDKTTTDQLVKAALGQNGGAAEGEEEEPEPVEGHPVEEPDETAEADDVVG